MDVRYWVPPGCTEPILQDMCSGCRKTIRFYYYNNDVDKSEKGDIINELMWHVGREDYYEPDEEG